MVYEVSDTNHLDFRKYFINIRYGVDHLTENGKHIYWNDDVFIMESDPLLKSVRTLPVTGLRRGIWITDMACDTSNVWIGTNQGLFSYNLKTEQTAHLTREEGLCSNTIQTLEISGNILYIGTDQGLTRYEIYE
jgi:ligand-binding sensor domain-containing protein